MRSRDRRRERPVGGRRRLDLILRLEASDGGDAVELWVEVKHGTAPHTHQLAAYQRASGRQRTVVMLLAPRVDLWSFDDPQVPGTVVRAAWEETGRTIAQLERLGQGPVCDFLATELTTYLQERG